MERAQVQDAVRVRDDCRLCGSHSFEKIWSFGSTPLANAYLRPDEVGRHELFAPLDVYYCQSCSLVQLRDVVSPEVLFSQYLYVSSTSSTFVRHFEDFATSLRERFGLTGETLVVDVGSNDGILLKPLRDAGVRVLGIDPARVIADAASAEGIETVAEFFTPRVAASVRRDHGAAQVIAANNVFAHTDDVTGFVAAVDALLADDGVFVFEVQYLGDLVAQNLFDIVYHEHVCYYHLHPLVAFFRQRGMEVFDVERPSVHGGSLRVFVQRAGGPHHTASRVGSLLQDEERHGLNTSLPYHAFAERIERNKGLLRDLIRRIHSEGKRIVGYGAPAKATTLMYAFGLDQESIEYIVDDDRRFKQGMLMPGTHIPIVSPDRLYEDRPDYCLILAWNFAEPIMRTHSRFTEQGGRFIIPVPKPSVVLG